MTDVRPTAEQSMVQSVARAITEAAAAPPPPPGGAMPFADGAWSALLDAGLLGLGVPEDLGGSGGGTVEQALVVEQLARGPVAVPILGHLLALALLTAATDSAHDPAPAPDHTAGPTIDRLRAEMLGGGPVGFMVDPELGWPGDAPLDQLAPLGPALDARPGQPVLALHRSAAGSHHLLLGTAERALDAVDLTRSMASVGGFVPVGQLADDAVVRVHAIALAISSAELLGTMHAALDAAVDHARQRHQFGRPIGSFQAVQHLCADALVAVEAARSIVWKAAWAVDARPPAEALHLARVAKAWCSEVALEVVETAVQVWGGTGITWECPAHLHQRRVLLTRRLFGDEHHHHARLAEELLGTGGPH